VALHLEIVTPIGAVVDTEAEEITLPGKLGEFGVLDGHIPFLSALSPGVVQYRTGTEWHRLAVGTGFAEVGAGRRVLVLTDTQARPEEVDAGEVSAELQEVEAELKAWTGPITPEHDALRSRAAWAQARLDAKAAAQGKKAR
jgi:F-type H+-transporting ATPase subunit epsilon